jgi:hypothetical protein
MAFSYVGSGAQAAGNNATSLTVAYPARAGGDLCLLHFQRFGGTNSRAPNTPSGWVQVANWLNGTSRHALYERITNGGEPSVVLTLTGTGVTGDTQLARIHAFRSSTGVPTRNVTGSTSTNASADNIGPITGITPGSGDLALISCGKANDINGTLTLSAWTLAAQSSSTTGNDAGMGLLYQLSSDGSATGDLTVTDNGGTASNGVGLGILVSYNEAAFPNAREDQSGEWTTPAVAGGASAALAGMLGATRATAMLALALAGQPQDGVSITAPPDGPSYAGGVTLTMPAPAPPAVPAPWRWHVDELAGAPIAGLEEDGYRPLVPPGPVVAQWVRPWDTGDERLPVLDDAAAGPRVLRHDPAPMARMAWLGATQAPPEPPPPALDDGGTGPRVIALGSGPVARMAWFGATQAPPDPAPVALDDGTHWDLVLSQARTAARQSVRDPLLIIDVSEPLSSCLSEDGWTIPVPVAPAAVRAVPPWQWDMGELPVAAAPFGLDENGYQPPPARHATSAILPVWDTGDVVPQPVDGPTYAATVLPLPPVASPAVPAPWRWDDGGIAVPASPFGLDDTGFQPSTLRQASADAVVTLWMVDEAAAFSPLDEDGYCPPVPATRSPVSVPVWDTDAYPTPAAPLGVQEDYWLVLRQAPAVLPPVRAVTDDDTWPQPPAPFGLSDDHPWWVPRSVAVAPAAVVYWWDADGWPTPASPFGLDDTEFQPSTLRQASADAVVTLWQVDEAAAFVPLDEHAYLPPVPVALPPVRALFWDTDAYPSPAAPLGIQEDYWHVVRQTQATPPPIQAIRDDLVWPTPPVPFSLDDEAAWWLGTLLQPPAIPPARAALAVWGTDVDAGLSGVTYRAVRVTPFSAPRFTVHDASQPRYLVRCFSRSRYDTATEGGIP